MMGVRPVRPEGVGNAPAPPTEDRGGRSAPRASPEPPSGRRERGTGLCVWLTSPNPAWLSEVARELGRWLERSSAEVELLCADGSEAREFGGGDGVAHRQVVAAFAQVAALLNRRAITVVVACPLRGESDRNLARRGVGRFVEVYLPSIGDPGERRAIPALVRRLEHGRLIEEEVPLENEAASVRPELAIDGEFGTPAAAAGGVCDALVRSGWVAT